jgi:hypothetical protein
VIIVSEDAKRIVHAVARAALPEGQSLRLETTTNNGGTKEKVVMLIEEAIEGDEAIEHEGEPLLYVSRKVSAAYDGCVVDLEQTPRGPALSIGPPLAGRNSRT